MNNQQIGVFDSGVGGLSVLLEIKRILPQESTVFVADQAYIPYGSKTKSQLIDRAEKIMGFFRDKEVKAVVVACNTATVYTIDEMRKKFQFPIIGTVPVIKTIANITRTGMTAVFTTPATAKSAYLKDLIDKFAGNVEVERVGGSNLEEIVEKGLINSPQTRKILKNILLPLIDNGVDAIALGCTHYPFLKNEIQKVVGKNVMLADSGGAVARRLKDVLGKENLLASKKSVDSYYTTGDKEKFDEVASHLTKMKIESIHINI